MNRQIKPREGYKLVKSFFGRYERIPEEWNYETIEDCCKVLDSNRIPLNSNERKKIQGNIPYYGANGILDHIDQNIFDEDLVLLAEDGGYFSEYQTKSIAQFVTGKSWVNNHAHVLANKSNYNLKFIFYSLVHKNIILWISGSTRTKLNQSELRRIKILIPTSKVEQQKIASILSGVDALIESTQKVIEKTERLKKGLMQKLFTHGIDKTSIILSRLDSIIFLQRGHDLPNYKRRIGKIPVIGSNGIVGYHNESKSNGPGVLIGRSGTLGKVYYVEEDYWPLNTSLYVKEFYSSFPKFVFYLLQNLDYEKFNAGTSVPTLNRNYLHPFKLKIPININEQQKIASILSGVDALRHHNIVALIILHIKLAIFLTLFVRILGSWIQQYRKKPTSLS